MIKLYGNDVSSYKLEFGIQHKTVLGKNDDLTWGLTYALGHKLGSDASCKVISTNATTNKSDTTSYTVADAFSIPRQVGVGLAWNHANKFKLGVDYSVQRWGKESYPVYTETDNKPSYALSDSYFKDRHKINFGGEYCGDEYSRRFLKRVRFRAGVSYATPYYKINGSDGPSELSVSAGFGIPIVNSYNNRSILNISGQWVKSSAKGFITENTFRLNIGLTFNERWFAKWKVE